MGALKTSEQGDSVAGEGSKDPASDDRPVDTGAKIIIGPEAIAAPPRPHPRAVTPTAPRAPRPSQAMPVPRKRGGLGLVILLYLLSAGALAYTIYERFVA